MKISHRIQTQCFGGNSFTHLPRFLSATRNVPNIILFKEGHPPLPPEDNDVPRTNNRQLSNRFYSNVTKLNLVFKLSLKTS